MLRATGLVRTAAPVLLASALLLAACTDDAGDASPSDTRGGQDDSQFVSQTDYSGP